MVEDGKINLWTVLKESILWNMKAFIERNKVPEKDRKDGEKEDYLVRGNITDQGVLNFFKATMGEEPIIAYMDEIKAEGKTLLKIPFSSSRKKQTIVVH